MSPLQTSETPAGLAARPFGIKVLLVWLGLATLSLLVNLKTIGELRFPDPDDILRLLQVRDWMAGQAWFDVHQYRIDPPRGAPMHWTRLIDPPIAALIAMLAPLLGQQGAELAALVAIPLLTFGVVVALVARLGRRLYGEEIGLYAALALGLFVPVQQQLRPLRIDHHGWQIAMAAIALNAAFARNARLGATIAGLALAFWLTISIEGLPIAAAFMGLFALRWLRDPQDSDWLAWGMPALAGGSALFWIIDKGPGALDLPYCDVVAPAHLAFFAVAACGSWLATRLTSPKVLPRIAALGVAAVAGIAALVAVNPQCATPDAFGTLDPEVRRFWYNRVHEGLPLWRQLQIGQMVQTVGVPLVALWSLARWWRSAGPVEGRVWFDYGLLVAAALAVAVMVERATAVALVFAAPAAVALVFQWVLRARQIEFAPRRILATLAALLALIPALPVQAVNSLFIPEQRALEKKIRKLANCGLADNLSGLNALPQSDVLAPLDTGPALLYASHHRIVASGHHRAQLAMLDVIHAFSGNPDQTQAIVRRRGIEYVAYCPGLFEPMIYQEEYPDGFLARLDRGEVPDWLEPVNLPKVNGLRVYRVK